MLLAEEKESGCVFKWELLHCIHFLSEYIVAYNLFICYTFRTYIRIWRRHYEK